MTEFGACLRAHIAHFKERHATRALAIHFETVVAKISTAHVPNEVREDVLSFVDQRLGQLAKLNLHDTYFAAFELDCLENIDFQLENYVRSEHTAYASELLVLPPGLLLV
jgi:hypothetical protein